MSDAPAWLEQLADGSLEEVKEAKAPSLVLPSGRIVACDPLVFLNGAEPFARTVAPGKYAVVLGRAHGENAYAMVRFAKRRVARWEVARCPGEEDVEGWPGYGVDSGTGCFVDHRTVQRFLELEDAVGERVAAKVAEEGVDPADPVAYHEAIEKHRAEEGPDPLDDVPAELERANAADVSLSDDEAAGNLVAFLSGPGDGVYASFWGLDAKDRPVCLVTDFGAFAEDDDSLDELDLAAELGGDPFADEEEEETVPVSADDLAGLEALAAALGGGAKKEPEERQGPSPLFLQTRDLVKKWVKEEKLELEPETDLDAFAEAFLERLAALSGSVRPGADVAEWLLERNEVADVFASDDELEADLTPD
ncbi:MAG TPA: DUF4241 domain-containing protein [Sandaracinaceae bacterium LLY-WYZ-13_1]|nr:DUF4241 domain-containing protein [Sandaracinaceae bacterium LLY-WYZ-13_1]